MSDILLIDDDAIFLSILSERLGHLGYRTFMAQKHEEALRQMQAHRPEKILLDLKIPGTSGLRLIPELLAIVPSCFIIVLTGYANIATAVEAIKLGARHYLAKPVGIEEILTAFERPEGDSSTPIEKAPPLSRLDIVEWTHIQSILEKNGGNISAAARELKMHRRTLQRKLQKRPPV